MREELAVKLQDEFSFMRDMYYECDSGWYELLRQLCAEITEIYNKNGLETDIEILQIKEKYGTLRFYYHIPSNDCAINNTIFETVKKWEEKSEEICESCGADGVLRKLGGWVCTLCGGCYKKQVN